MFNDSVLVICPHAGQRTGVFILLLYHYYFYVFKACLFISGSGDKRGHGKTPLFMAGMKCLPLCKVI